MDVLSILVQMLMMLVFERPVVPITVLWVVPISLDSGGASVVLLMSMYLIEIGKLLLILRVVLSRVVCMALVRLGMLHSYLCSVCLRWWVSWAIVCGLRVRCRTNVSARSIELRRRVVTLVCVLSSNRCLCVVVKVCWVWST